MSDILQVWKFDLQVVFEQPLSMPEGAKALCVQTQDGYPKLWAECDPSKPRIQRVFRTLTTGEDFPPSIWKYVGTYQMGNGAFVAHVYEVL